MYVLSAEERRYLQRAILPEARAHAVAEELRGWSWSQPPLKPLYDQPLDASDLAAEGCATGRDLYLQRILGVTPTFDPLDTDGTSGCCDSAGTALALRQAVAPLIAQARQLVLAYGSNCLPHLRTLLVGQDTAAPAAFGEEPPVVTASRWFEAVRLLERVQDVLAAHPGIGGDALAALALPMTVELPLRGWYLGLTDTIVLPALLQPELLVISVHVGPRRPAHRLVTTAYALTLESLFEAPVQAGCCVYVRFANGCISLERDIHVIGEELRQTFIETRDERMRLLEHEQDPGLPSTCPTDCPYLATCRPRTPSMPVRRPSQPDLEPLTANLTPQHPGTPAFAA